MSWLLAIAWLAVLLCGLRIELQEHRRLARMAKDLREGRP
jgi:hypothetical protein